jgi:hypothetical protein
MSRDSLDGRLPQSMAEDVSGIPTIWAPADAELQQRVPRCFLGDGRNWPLATEAKYRCNVS